MSADSPISISFQGDVELIANLRTGLHARISGRVQAQLEIEANGLKQAIQDKIRSLFKSDTGNLENSVQILPPEVTDTRTSIDIVAGGDLAPYGIYFELGGKGEYLITPVSKKALSFLPTTNIVTFKHFGKVYTEAIARKIIIHPSIPHRPFFNDTVAEAEPGIVDRLNAAVGEAIEE